MKVLVACEFSGIVRDAFLKKGHDAWSCDLLPTESPGPHIQDDVLKHFDEGWDLMIAHPPCTHIAVSGRQAFKKKWLDGRQHDALIFFVQFMKTSIPKVGDTTSKSICLWLKHLPLLKKPM